MSLFFDCFWWWRKEFLGQPDPFEPLNHSDTADPLLNMFGGFPDIGTYDANYFGLAENIFLYERLQ
jgi:hypothetical protein